MILNSKRKIKKVALTGHTSGIGQGLYKYFQERGNDVCGFSRSNGFVLPGAESQVLEQIQDCDIFVNNALPVVSQISLLKQLWPKWVNANKKIIVIGSIITQFDDTCHWASTISEFPVMQEYQKQKLELDRLCKSFQYGYNKWPIPCSLTVINPGYVATNIFIPGNPPAELFMSVDQVVSVVDYVLNSPLQFDTVAFRK